MKRSGANGRGNPLNVCKRVWGTTAWVAKTLNAKVVTGSSELSTVELGHNFCRQLSKVLVLVMTFETAILQCLAKRPFKCWGFFRGPGNNEGIMYRKSARA